MNKGAARQFINAAFERSREIGFIISQSPGELAVAAEEIRATDAHVVLEIGCQHLGWMYAIRPFCMHNVKYIAVDPAFSNGSPIYRKLLEDSGVEVKQINGTSMANYTNVNEAVGHNNWVDICHIDGDHSTEAVLLDFEMYHPIVRHGGLVLIHDVCGSQGPGAALQTILQKHAAKFAYTMVYCDSWWHEDPCARMGIAMLRMK
jgi:cephalosporin hydroxylase